MSQIFTALAVSTGCLSYGICMAYTSSAIPSMMSKESSLSITYAQASWMSMSFVASKYNIYMRKYIHKSNPKVSVELPLDKTPQVVRGREGFFWDIVNTGIKANTLSDLEKLRENILFFVR